LSPAQTEGSAADRGASFRDPAGSVLRVGGRILRVVNPSGQQNLATFLESAAVRERVEAGDMVKTTLLSDGERSAVLADRSLREYFERASGAVLLEHERIPFPSFPYEWPPEMLYAAAALTLDLAESLLRDGIGLKDATPYNVLFRGPRPVFVDILSIERREPGDPTWLPYAQFVRTFLLPLLASRDFGLPPDQILVARRDGLEPGDVYRWCSPWQRVRPPFLSLVSLPAWLERRHNPDDQTIYRKTALADHEKARFIFESLIRRLRRQLAKVAPREGAVSTWSDYTTSNNNYTAEHAAAKERFVEEALQEFRPARVLDIGCNTGVFSVLAARAGASVVAIDTDPVVLGTLWRRAGAENLDVLPLAVNLARPTPGMGWRNRECPSFLERAAGGFDAVMMLAVVHHLLVTERVPLREILSMAADLTRDLALIEFVSPEDSMFQRLTRGRAELHRDLNHELFETLCRERFEILRVQHLEGATRWVYVLRKQA